MRPQSIPPELTDEQLEALSVITAAEREDAASMWRVDCMRQGKALNDAPEYDGEDGG
jgi:hypothetical protein